MSEPDAKPCPFCNAPHVHRNYVRGDVDVRSWHVYLYCKVCGARGPVIQYDASLSPEAAFRSALEKWNGASVPVPKKPR